MTSCLPWPQKGPSIPLPLGTSAPVSGDITGDGRATFDYGSETDQPWSRSGSASDKGITVSPTPSNTEDLTWGDPALALSNATADLTNATAATINELRESFQIQRLFERDARGGTRYTEILRSHFGVVSPDQRLQRPEYLGGGSMVINVNPVASTSAFTGGSGIGVGELAAFVTGSGNSGFTKSFVEHGVILGFASVRADLNYQQGLDRMFSRRTRFDFYLPVLAHLGEQSVLNKEIFADGSASDEEIFGYQERWAEYRFKPSKVTGQMRSNAATSLDPWHLAQEFEDLPLLNEEFIVENPPIDRVIAVPSEPQFLFNAWFTFSCARPMPTFSVPGLIDHF